ncbi:hypothetical protein ACFQ60_01065 [Streptomyces zhihengii]|uniref:Uncharacterized protein n=1 Tax=Streptomyces zhihengii TaxID=1818004 RepID=A0ABS2V5T3_9ACTN|nr:hypothetical protein [Streptomyces zhihengii]MBM9624315.1 hypothetical protein [Streptomyces zhihengii]
MAAHLALDRFDPVGVVFDDAGAPRQCQADGYGGEIAVEAVGEGLEVGQVGGADRFDPLREPVALECDDHPPGRLDMTGESVQFRAVREH